MLSSVLLIRYVFFVLCLLCWVGIVAYATNPKGFQWQWRGDRPCWFTITNQLFCRRYTNTAMTSRAYAPCFVISSVSLCLCSILLCCPCQVWFCVLFCWIMSGGKDNYIIYWIVVYYGNQWVLWITKDECSFCILCVRFSDSAQTSRVVSHLYRQITIAWWQTNQKRVASSRMNQQEKKQ